MAVHEIKIPSPGESITEVEIGNWLKQDGDLVQIDESLCEIESDKAILEAELFSLDGKKRFYVKSSNKLNLAKNLGIQVGKLLKKRSKNSYKR